MFFGVTVSKQKIDKHEIRREIRANDKLTDTILSKLNGTTTKLIPEDNQKLHSLIKRNNELHNILKPPSINEPVKQQKAPDNALEGIEKKYNTLHDGATEMEGYCQNCGAPNNHNVMNGKLWCFKCNLPLLIMFKKPERKPDPKLKGVSVEEQAEFFLKQKQYGFR